MIGLGAVEMVFWDGELYDEMTARGYGISFTEVELGYGRRVLLDT